MFKVRACLIFPLKLSYKLGTGCVAFSMPISSIVCKHKGSDKEICNIDAQCLNTQMMLFFSVCFDVDGEGNRVCFHSFYCACV